jgi:hypothetical protein
VVKSGVMFFLDDYCTEALSAPGTIRPLCFASFGVFFRIEG